MSCSVRQSLAALLLLSAVSLAGCGMRADDAESVSGDTISLAEEIAAGNAGDGTETIPAEAYEYYALDYEVPEGFAAAEGNTSASAVYYSLAQGDYSYIAYERQGREETESIGSFSGESYAAVLSELLSTEVTVESCETEEAEGALRAEVRFRYPEGELWYYGREVLYETERYLFRIVYCRAEGYDWETDFARSANGLRLVNVVSEREEAPGSRE